MSKSMSLIDMALPKPTTARSIAAETLCEAELRREFAGEILNKYLQLTEMQRATDLVFGVLRNRKVIDLVIERFSSFLITRVTIKILNILRVAVFELIYCPQTVEYAIVNEAVEYAKHVAGAKQAGFVNAVLRQTLRHILNRQKVLETYLLCNTVPQTQHTGCEFSIELFPDRDASPAEYLSIVFSLPEWLVKSWFDAYGREQTEKICFASNRRPSIYLRPNSLITTVDLLADKLKTEGVDCEIIAESKMIKLISPGSIAALPGFDEGLFSVQDLSAVEAVRFLNPQLDWTILDLCAAPGTKTIQLAQTAGGTAKIVATDIDSSRLEKVKQNVARIGLSHCVTIIEYNALDDFVKRFDGFDCVLVDAPCSNTGVLARRPEVRHRITLDSIVKLTRVQGDLLSKAAELLKPGGVLCYSTCSIQPQENSVLIKGFLQDNSGFALKEEKLVLPSAEGFDHDGGYMAVLAKMARDASRTTGL
ncbi:MAG: transcription antitermination factor NusB [Planctomycetota bacterium]